MVWNVILVAVGGFFGAVSRYGISNWMKKRFPSAIPYGTLFINLTGAFLLGIIAGSGLQHSLTLLLGTGFMGAYTTFSTFKLENVQLGKQKQWGALLVYLGISYTAGILLAFLGYLLGTSSG
jgi:CrcB protein